MRNKLKEIELQIEQDFKDLEGNIPDQEFEKFKEQIDNKLGKKKKKHRKKRKKKTHHDMKLIKQKRIKKMVNNEQSSDDNLNIKKFFVKDFKSDHESFSRQRSKSKPTHIVKNEDLRVENINIEPFSRDSGEIKEISNSLAPANNHSPKPPNSPAQSKPNSRTEEIRKSKENSNQHQIKDQETLKFQKSQSNMLGMKEYSDQSVASENKRYRSVERPKNFYERFNTVDFNNKYPASKYSLSHNSDNISNQSQEKVKHKYLRSVGSLDKVLAFELKNVKDEEIDSKSDDGIVIKNKKEEIKEVTPKIIKKIIKKESKLKEEPIISSEVPLEKKNYDEIVKESLDFATFLKNQANELNN